MDNGVGFSDMREKFVPQSLAFGGALDKSRDIDKFDHGGRVFFRMIHFRKRIEPRIRHGDHPDVWLDGAERIIGRLGACVCDGVEKRAFADVRQADDSEFHSLHPLPYTYKYHFHHNILAQNGIYVNLFEQIYKNH